MYVFEFRLRLFGNIIVIVGFWNISTSSDLCCHFLLLPTSIQYPKITNYLSKMPLLCLFWNIIVIIVGFWNTRTSSSSLWCHFLLLTVATTNQLRPRYFVKVPMKEWISLNKSFFNAKEMLPKSLKVNILGNSVRLLEVRFGSEFTSIV